MNHKHEGDPVEGALARLVESIAREVSQGHPERIRVCANEDVPAGCSTTPRAPAAASGVTCRPAATGRRWPGTARRPGAPRWRRSRASSCRWARWARTGRREVRIAEPPGHGRHPGPSFHGVRLQGGLRRAAYVLGCRPCSTPTGSRSAPSGRRMRRRSGSARDRAIADTTATVPHPYERPMADGFIATRTAPGAEDAIAHLGRRPAHGRPIAGDEAWRFIGTSMARNWVTGPACRTGAGAIPPKPRARVLAHAFGEAGLETVWSWPRAAQDAVPTV